MLLVSLSLYSSTQRASLWQGSEHVEVAHAKYGNHFPATAEAGTESRAPKLTLFAAPVRSALPRSRLPTVSTSSLTSSRGLPGTTV